MAALRDAVLARSDKRMPKWKFQLASDIVTQIQPRPATRTRENRDGLPWFDCFAVIRDNADASVLKDPPLTSWRLEFKLTIRSDRMGRFPTTWNFEARKLGYHTGCAQEDRCAVALLVRERLIAILPVALAELRPSVMLQPFCLMCSKRLTDPVSMARWIGPECFGSSANIMPFVVELGSV
jgi:hypothetical protein